MRILWRIGIVCALAGGTVSPLCRGGYAYAQPAGQSQSAEEIKRQAARIVAQPEFRRVREKRGFKVQAEPPSPEPSWLIKQLRRFFEWLGDKLHWSISLGGLSWLMTGLAYTLLAAVIVCILWLLFRGVQRYLGTRESKQVEQFEEGDAGVAPGETPADEYLRRAAEFARQGNFREAIAQLVLGAKSHTERQGLIRFRRGLTHRDYVRALKPRPDQQSALRTIIGVYEPICFGRRPAEPEHYQLSASGYETGFGHA